MGDYIIDYRGKDGRKRDESYSTRDARCTSCDATDMLFAAQDAPDPCYVDVRLQVQGDV